MKMEVQSSLSRYSLADFRYSYGFGGYSQSLSLPFSSFGITNGGSLSHFTVEVYQITQLVKLPNALFGKCRTKVAN
jgi:hypothetical protein